MLDRLEGQYRLAAELQYGDGARGCKDDRDLHPCGDGSERLRGAESVGWVGDGEWRSPFKPQPPIAIIGFPDSEKPCGFAALREKILNRGSCQRCRGVKSDSRKGMPPLP